MASEGGSAKSKVFAALIVGMVLGVAGASFVAWFVVEKNPASFGNGMQRDAPKPVAQALPPAPLPVIVAASAPAPVAQPASAVEAAPQYEFYKVLPDKAEGAAARKQAAAPVAVAPSKPAAQPSADNAQYYVQAGAFQSAEDADKLKAKLTLTGMDASVQKAEVPGKGVWYRVRLGPYKGQAEASEVVADLKQNGIANATALHAQ